VASAPFQLLSQLILKVTLISIVGVYLKPT
jgi:hypothetical protein